MDAIARLAAHVAHVRYDDLPPAAVAAAKIFVLDTLGVAVAGSGEPWAARLAATSAAWGAGDEARVWGTGVRRPGASAALVNAYQVHALEFDCVHEGAVVHPMATLLSAVLAASERDGGVDGKRLVAAVAAGTDVACSIGAAARSAMRFFRPANAGAFGAVAALANLWHFDVEAALNAFGIVYGHVSGTLQPHLEGSMQLGVQMGFNARGALTAADLAASGFAGPRDVLEGRYGYFRLFEADTYDVDAALAGLGRTWRVGELSHKPFPSGRLTHGVVDAIAQLVEAHGIQARHVARVRAHVPPLVARLVGRPDLPVPDASYARLCLPFVAAVALCRGTVDVPDFRDDRLLASEVHDAARRIEIVPDGSADENAIVPQTVEVTLHDGRRHAVEVHRVLGHPERPLSRERHLEKFRRCLRYGARPVAAGSADALIALVDRLEHVSDLRELIDPLG
jgi:2-methylcitrate dehydratase PrpD